MQPQIQENTEDPSSNTGLNFNDIVYLSWPPFTEIVEERHSFYV